MTADVELPRAITAHLEGRFAEAKEIYLRVAARDSENAEVYHLLGVLRHQETDLENAKGDFERALSLRPDFSEAHNALANLLVDTGDPEGAEQHYREAISLVPSFAEALTNLGDLLRQKGDLRAAQSACEQALALKPGLAIGHNNLGAVLKDQEEIEAAIVLFERALVLDPDLAVAHLNLSDALRQTGKFEQALFHARRTTELAPEASASWNIFGAVSFDRDDLEVSVAAFEQALALDPKNADAHSNIGNVEMRAGRLDAARGHYEQALTLDNAHADAMVNLGTALQIQGALDEALNHYDRVLARHPKHTDARWNRALTLLMGDDYEAGFEAYEIRWELPQFIRREFSGIPWDGAPLEGKRLLVTAEQGYGDTIQMARFLMLLGDCRGEIIVETYPPLAMLIKGIPGIRDVVLFGGDLPAYDFHTPIMSLPHLLGISVDTLPRKVPYLRGPNRDVPTALADDRRFKVGLVWRGRPSAKNFLGRPCPLEAFAPLTAIDNISLYSLQVGEAIADIADLSWGEKVIDLGSSFTDFADTAASIDALDLVISIDTAVAHLAGALGADCWTLLSIFSDWRWGRNRSDSLWYPTMRLFRQSEPGRWDDVLEDVRRALTVRVSA